MTQDTPQSPTTQEALKIARDALKDMLDPIAAMKRDLPEGYELNAPMAVQMASDVQWYKRVATETLAATAAPVDAPSRELPPLPRRTVIYPDSDERLYALAYTADQMRTYACAALAQRAGAPDEAPDTSQEWARLDGATAFHLIERHADDWAETGRMMESWGKARFCAAVAVPVQAAQPAQAVERDAARYNFIEQHATKYGGGHGFTIVCFVGADTEDMGCGIDQAIDSMTKENES